jgi:hypothetical protein
MHKIKLTKITWPFNLCAMFIYYVFCCELKENIRETLTTTKTTELFFHLFLHTKKKNFFLTQVGLFYFHFLQLNIFTYFAI